jgi:CRP/FNR family cyclic AMP-dependent transcriptional regulator
MRKVLFILGQLSDLDIEWLITAGRKQQIPAGTTLIHEGREIDALYIVLEGALAVHIQARSGQGAREIVRLRTGEMVGEMSFIDARPPSATVQAIDVATVLAIPRQQLAVKLEQDTGFAARFYRALAMLLSDRLRGTNSQLGYGGDQPQPLPTGDDDEGELDPNLLGSVALAGTRFDLILKRLMNN